MLGLLAQAGNALAMQGDFAEAEAIHRHIVRLRPDLAAAWNNLGNLFRIQSRPDEAADAFRRAISADANFAPGYCNLGNALKDQGNIEEAIVAFRRAVELAPTDAEMHSNLVYATCFSPDYDAAKLFTEARGWADRHAWPLLGSHRPFAIDANPSRRLRIGYVSMDFRNHVVGRNVLPILEHHDRGRFEIHCFSVLASHDAMTARFIAAAERWHECAAMDAAALAEKIRAERIDILVDLSLHMAGNRLLTFARKPAPVQVTWAGYPGTTGLGSIDFRLTDPHLDPPGRNDAFYSEQSIRLPHSFWCYRPMEGMPEVNALPAATAGFVTLGCLNNFAKVTGEVLELWAQIMRQTPGSRLLLLCPSDVARRKVLAFFASRNIGGDRIQFIGMTPPEMHMRRYHAVDICLDPMPYTGHTTTLDALWMGVPVVTLSGNTSLSRGSVTGLSLVGLKDLIAVTPGDYVQHAVRLAGDLPRLQALRGSLRDQLRCSPICDESGFTGDLESACLAMWDRRTCR